MEKQTKTKIKNLALALRDDLEKEIENRLDNIGIYIDKEWKDGRSLTHLSKDEIEKRKRVAAFIKREEKIGLDQRKATSEFIKEASYTWINRLLGLKCMECRGLIEEVITTKPEYGGRSKRHRDFRDKNPDKAAKPDDALPACLFSAFEEVTEEIKVLFDPKNEYSLVIPRYPTLKKAIEKINTELDYNTYREDEFLGWVYQYFNSREKDRVFEEVRTKKKKISGSDIINVTQLYTEKYMVRFLVENSLGAMWMEMHPDSQLCNKWEYFVKDPNNSRREPKPVKEIKFLDPAGGSGHFQLYAFDLFYDMYLEEGETPRDQIPEFILRHNLHGIDIDLRAIQLSALGLYMKAKSKNPDMKVQHMNLVSADAIMLDSDILEEFLQEFKDDKTAQELIKTIWQGLENVRELGSLLKVEEQIDEVIKRQKDKRLDFFGDGKEKGWELWKSDLLAALKRYYEKAAQTFDINKQMFANEACKGVQLLDLLEQRYDVVATNPPYMHKRNLAPNIKEYLKINYPGSDLDLYSAFIERNLKFMGENKYVSMITQQTFMFIKKYEKLRVKLFEKYSFKCLAYLGPHAFEDITGEKVNTTMFVLSNYRYHKGVYLKLDNSTDKSNSLIETINKESKNEKFLMEWSSFKNINGYPFVFWISDDIRNLFIHYKSLDAYSIIKQGLATGNNDKFLRYFWEVEKLTSKKIWKSYAKGGEFNKWFTNIDLVINWEQEAIEDYKKTQFAQIYVSKNAEKYISQDCLTYTLIGGKSLSMRFLKAGSITDVSGSSIFSTDYSLYYLISILNSKLISFILNFLNPTLSFQVGDLKNIPFIKPLSEVEKNLSKIGKKNVEIKKSLLESTLNSCEFKQTAIQWGYDKTKK